MKAVVYHGGTDLRYEDLPMPAPGPEEAIVKVGYAGICGSDITISTGKHKRVKPPVVIGHELAGTVVEVGPTQSGLKVGDRVVVEPLLPCGECFACLEGGYNACSSLRHLGIDVNGMFAEYVKVKASKAYPIPESMSMERAALVEPTAVAVHCVRKSGARVGDRVVVLGGGPIGILTAQVARVATSAPVELVEVSDWRLDFARKLGFDPIDAKKGDVVQQLLERIGRGADILIDTAGVGSTAMQMTAMTRIRGLIVMLAMPKEPLMVDLNAFPVKEIGMVGSRAYVNTDWHTAIPLIADGEVQVDPLVSQIMPLDDWREGLEIAKKADASMKILLNP